ncbi:MAG: peptidase M23 [Proteobacteria bacterium]|nr:MAG: peptidase M23 [Pseudomonadota bacterium]
MKVICIGRDGTRFAAFKVSFVWHLLLPISLMVLVMMALAVNQFVDKHQRSWVDTYTPQANFAPEQAEKLMAALGQQLNAVYEMKQAYADYTVDVDTLAVRLGALEAEMARLNAVAKRVIKRAKLDPEEFGLEQTPPRGGLEENYMPAVTPSVSNQALLGTFEQTEMQIDRHRSVLEGLYQILAGLALEQEIVPSFSPVNKGYISSRFGSRRDPFNGRMRQHRGLDFAGPKGTDIYSVAGGVVSFVGRRGGYGKVVEVDHGSGFLSRYAHLNEVLVENGTVVTKGSRIAAMGSTGRSTGSHLHLEILQNGEPVDPEQYLENLE